jgi:formiminoglutamate deiminase
MIELHVERALLDTGWAEDVLITIDGTEIAAVAAGVKAPASAEHSSGIAVPGVGNVHSHSFQRAMAGLAERRGDREDSFWTWREVMYRFLARMTPDDIEAVAAWLYVEMLEAGFTTIGEFHYLHNAPDGSRYADPAETAGSIVAAAAASDIGLTLLPCFYAHGGCGGQPPTAGQARFLSDVDSFAKLMEGSRRHLALLGRGTLGIAPHSLRAVTPDQLHTLLQQNPSGPVHIHAAEQMGEVEQCMVWSSARPVEWLLANMPVDQRWCLIHCTHMTEKESQGLAASGAVTGLCPITEASLGDGIFEAPRFLDAGGRLAVGSDSNIRISLAEELRTLEYGQRLRDHKRNRVGRSGISTGRALFDHAREGAAQALGLRAGGLVAGAPADVLILDDQHPALMGRSGDTLLDSWIFTSGDGVVRDVFASGRHVVKEGHHIAREQLLARFKATMAALAGDV